MAFNDTLSSEHLDQKRVDPLQFYEELWIEGQNALTGASADRYIECSRIQGAVRVAVSAKTAVSIPDGGTMTVTITASKESDGTYTTVATHNILVADGVTTFDADEVIGYAEIPVEAGPYIKVDYSVAAMTGATGTIDVFPDLVPR